MPKKAAKKTTPRKDAAKKPVPKKIATKKSIRQLHDEAVAAVRRALL